ncbi:MAG: peptide deformylase, partial [Spirochaetia bacterium]|nr:peptide deformylase [Spirochaetia bacterium]
MREVVIYGDSVLQTKAGPVTQFGPELELLCAEMFDAMKHDRGIGLAAPQVGVSSRIFVTDVEGDRKRVFVNPEIIMTSPEQVEYEEGCLSFPGLYFMVKRPASVKVQAFDEKGKSFTLEAKDMLARVILHETDHLDGKLFI